MIRGARSIPTLGPRGEGWVVLQSVLILAIGLAAWRASLDDVSGTAPLAGMRMLGTVALLGGLALVAAGMWFLRASRSLSVLPRPLDAGALVEDGPYRFIRHPIYAGVILAGFAVALIRLSWLVAVPAILLAVVLDLKRRREEAWLMDRYAGYEAYRRRTRALIPFIY